MFIIWKIAWRNIVKNWRHSFASLMALTIGFVALSLFQGFISSLSELFHEMNTHFGMFADVILEKDGGEGGYLEDPMKYALNKEEQDKIKVFLDKEDSKIDVALKSLRSIGLISNGNISTIFMAVALEEDKAAKIRGESWAWNTMAGKPMHLSTMPHSVTFAGRLAKLMDCTFKESTNDIFTIEGGYVPKERPFKCNTQTFQMQVNTESGQTNTLDVNLAGISESGMKQFDDKYIQMPLKSAHQLLDSDKITLVTILLKDANYKHSFVKAFNDYAKSIRLPVHAFSWDLHPIFGELYRKSISLFSITQIFISGIIIFVGIMSIMNTMMKQVIERTREIGTMRSIGYRPNHILSLFVCESFLLSVLASILGVIVTIIIANILNAMHLMLPPGMSSFPIPANIAILPFHYIVTAVGFGIVAMISAVIPAKKASRMKVSEALLHI